MLDKFFILGSNSLSMHLTGCLRSPFFLFIAVVFLAVPVTADAGTEGHLAPSLSAPLTEKNALASAGHSSAINDEGVQKSGPAVSSVASVPPSEGNGSDTQRAQETLPNVTLPATEENVVTITIQGDQKRIVTNEKNTGKNDESSDMSFPTNTLALSAIEKSIGLFRDRIKEKFTLWLERSARYLEIMKGILREKQMPEELVFLPIIESGFNLHAYSRARAVGPWQFIEATAKRYGLIVDWWRDERRDPVKSTEAAAEYLKDLYGMFGSWNLALAAYNAGEGRIAKALKKTAADDYWELLGTRQIRNETKEYVPQFFAARMIAHAPEEYGFYNLVYHEPLQYDEVYINSPLDVDVIARCAGVPVQTIRDLNPELRRWSTPPNVGQYTIRIPIGSKETFSENLLKTPVEEQFSYDTYKVKKGDTLKKVAKKTSFPVNVIAGLNSMSGIEQLEPGREIKLPPKGKYFPDLDDRVSAKRALYTKKPSKQKALSKQPKRMFHEVQTKVRDRAGAKRI